MIINAQEINKQLSRWNLAKQELTRQYEECLKDMDLNIGLCHTMLQVVSAKPKTIDINVINGIAEGTHEAPSVETLTEVGVGVTNLDVYLNGNLLRNGANTTDVYPEETPANGPLKVEGALNEDDEDDEEEPLPPTKKAPVEKVSVGRGGKPHIIDSMLYVLDLYGSLHPTDIAAKIEEHGLNSKSKNLVDYIRITLSKNKDKFSKVVGQRGMWQAALGSKGAPLDPKAESSASAGDIPVLTADDEIGEKPEEIKEIEAFRERERVGTIRLSPEEAKAIVEEMTDPRNLEPSDVYSPL
jgi:hypothetical protein